MNFLEMYEREKTYRNNLSFWFPKIKDCRLTQNIGGPNLLIPRTIIVPIPSKVYAAFESDFEFESRENCETYVREFVDKVLKPIMEKNGIQECVNRWFVKNGCYSGKYDFQDCVATLDTIHQNFTNICYGAACNEAMGNTEFVIRSLIGYDTRKVATIYNGLPLRTEIRVFYDFDKREVMYSANYWDYDYVRPHLYALTDQIVFDHQRNRILEGYEKHRPVVEEMVAKAMQNVDLDGKWSIDIMVDECHRGGDGVDYWLIDMAEAHRSAYWKGDPFDG